MAKMRIERYTFGRGTKWEYNMWMVTDGVHEEAYETWVEAVEMAEDWIRNG